VGQLESMKKTMSEINKIRTTTIELLKKEADAEEAKERAQEEKRKNTRNVRGQKVKGNRPDKDVCRKAFGLPPRSVMATNKGNAEMKSMPSVVKSVIDSQAQLPHSRADAQVQNVQRSPK